MSHSSTVRAGGRSRSLILTAMIFAVAMLPDENPGAGLDPAWR